MYEYVYVDRKSWWPNLLQRLFLLPHLLVLHIHSRDQALLVLPQQPLDLKRRLALAARNGCLDVGGGEGGGGGQTVSVVSEFQGMHPRRFHLFGENSGTQQSHSADSACMYRVMCL